MYFNLARKNVKKSYKDYFVYFITLMISVGLFYLFNSFDAQQSILELDPDLSFGFKTLMSAMGILSYFVTFVFGFLILYANNFIMKRRKQEIALYTLLGMKKSHVSRIMLYETFLVGLLSLGFGIVLGIFASQGVAAFTGYLLQVDIKYHFIVSFPAIIKTIINFSLIFIIVGIFNNILMNRAKLIELFKARQTSEKVAITHPVLMSIIMIVSIGILAYLYNFVLQPMMLLKYLLQVLFFGSLATFGVFYGISFWFVRISQSLKSYYYKDLNAFSTRQISSKISSTYKLLASVSLMLLLSFGSLATAFNVNTIINKSFNRDFMYDYNISIAYGEDTDSFDFLKQSKLEEKYDVKSLKVYQTNLISNAMNEKNYLYTDNQNLLTEIFLPINLINLDDYNMYRREEGKSEILLKDDETIYYLPQDYLNLAGSEKQLLNDEIELAGHLLSVKNHDDNSTHLGSSMQSVSLNFVLNETSMENLLDEINKQNDNENNPGIVEHLYNIRFQEGQNPQIESKAITELLRSELNNENILSYSYTSKVQNLNEAQQMTLLVTYLGLYLGLTFIVVSVMVISLQLLSEASDNYERYLLLDKIGVTQKLQKRSIFKQNLTYFALPLLVALIHSVIGIKAVNETMAFGGLVTTSYEGIFLGVGILVVIYVIYFLVTYFSSVRMIFDRKNN